MKDENTNINLDENTNVSTNVDENTNTNINIDDIYDGSLNQTVVIDPVTNSEILMKKKRFRSPIFGFLLAILVLSIFFTYTSGQDVKKIFTDFYKNMQDISDKIFQDDNVVVPEKEVNINIEKKLECTLVNEDYEGIKIEEYILVVYNDKEILTYEQNTNVFQTEDLGLDKYTSIVSGIEQHYSKFHNTTGYDLVFESVPEKNMSSIKNTIYYDVFNFEDLYPGTTEIMGQEYDKYILRINNEKDITEIKANLIELNYICVDK